MVVPYTYVTICACHLHKWHICPSPAPSTTIVPICPYKIILDIQWWPQWSLCTITMIAIVTFYLLDALWSSFQIYSQIVTMVTSSVFLIFLFFIFFSILWRTAKVAIIHLAIKNMKEKKSSLYTFCHLHESLCRKLAIV